jgi:hypothetical protein
MLDAYFTPATEGNWKLLQLLQLLQLLVLEFYNLFATVFHPERQLLTGAAWVFPQSSLRGRCQAV